VNVEDELMVVSETPNGRRGSDPGCIHVLVEELKGEGDCTIERNRRPLIGGVIGEEMYTNGSATEPMWKRTEVLLTVIRDLPGLSVHS
jgi:hypothetical protein